MTAPATSYHAHLYWTDALGRATADCLLAELVARFGELVPWLMLNRGGLSVLVHPETGDARADHTAHALWLGAPLPINLDAL